MTEQIIEENGEIPFPTDSDGDDEIACPWCGKSFGDLWDRDFGHNECIDTECPHCNKEIILCVNISVDYTCYAKAEKSKENS